MDRQTNMMPNGMQPQQNMAGMQRPQPGNINTQIHAQIMTDLRAKMGQTPAGWQSTFDIGQRANRILQLVSGLRMLQPDVQKCLQIAENFEERIFGDSFSKEMYVQQIDVKLGEIKNRRIAQVPNVQAGPMGLPQNNIDFGPPQNMGDMNMMQNNGMGGMNMGMNFGANMQNVGMGMQGGQQMGGNGQQNQNFPTHLQRQMQASPLPPQQSQQNNTIDPSVMQNPSANQFNGEQPANVASNGQNQNQPYSPPQLDIITLAKQMYNSTNDERKNALRTQFMGNLDEQRRNGLLARGGDPLITFFMAQAKEILVKRHKGQLGQGVQQQNSDDVQQASASQAGQQNFDFTNLLGQQANAIKLAESGEQVVPASNNVNVAGQVNMSQGMNPQMLNNQNGQAGNNQQQQQMQHFMALQARQKQIEQQNQLARSQAMAQQQQQNQSRGQPGGLSAPNALNGGQVNSPAMNMLNRPMAPPGQAPPATPQQNRPGMAQTPVTGANQLAQHHQHLLNQNNQQQQMNQGGQAPTQRQQLINSLPEELQQKLSQVPPEQVNMFLARHFNSGNMNPNAMNNQQGAQALPQNMNMGVNMTGAQMGQQQQQQQQGMPNMQPNMGSAVPAFNTQPPQNQQQQPQQTQSEQQQLQHRLQQNQLRQKALDFRPFPRAVLSQLSLAVPDAVVQWGQLRLHINRNQAVLPPNTVQRMQAAQTAYFNAHPEEVRAAMMLLQQRMQQAAQAQQQQQQQQQGQPQQQQPPGPRPQSSMAMPNGQAPPAQMLQANNAMQQAPNQNAAAPGVNAQQLRMPPQQQMSQQEIEVFRQKFPNASNMTDEQIRAVITNRRMQHAQQQAMNAQQQQALGNQMQRAQVTGNSVPQGNVPQPNQQRQQPPQRAQPPQQVAKPQPAQGQKRQQPSTDDVMEIPNPNTNNKGATGAQQAPPMQANISQPPPQGQLPQNLTQADFNNMSQEQKMLTMQRIKQMEALRKAQAAAQPPAQAQQAQMLQQPNQVGPQQQGPNARNQPNAQERQRMARLHGEAIRENPKGPAINLDQNSIMQVQTMIKELWQWMSKIEQSYLTACRAGLSDQRLKDIMKWRIVFFQNAADANGTIKDYLSVTPHDMGQMKIFMSQYMMDLRAAGQQGQPNANGAQVQQQQQQVQPPVQQQAPPTKAQQPPAQLDRKPSQQGNARKASAASNKAPPAPTDNNKTFDWGSPSPHGVPKYDVQQTGLTAEKLKLPAQKKRKTSQQAEKEDTKTAVAAGSPSSVDSKSQSQEQVAKMQQQQVPQKPAEPEKQKHKCEDLTCDASVTGFDTLEELNEHKETAHRPIENPLKFLLESAADALGLDRDGNPLPKKAVKAPSAVTKPASKKGGQPAVFKRESATPATPSSAGKAGVKQVTSVEKKATDKTPPDSAVEAPRKEKTLIEVMAENVGYEWPQNITASAPTDLTEEDEWYATERRTSTTDNEPTYPTSLADLADVTHWNLPRTGFENEFSSSPELTPSDQSPHSSDIGQSERLRINLEWDAFGNGDTGVPESLMMGLGLDGGGVGWEDVVMGDGEGAENAGGKEKWDWSSDLVNWDTAFGLGEGDGMMFDASMAI